MKIIINKEEKEVLIMTTEFPHIGLENHISPWNDRSLQNNASYRRNITIINCLPVDIAVATRDGLRFTIDKRCSVNENNLIVRVETFVDSNIKKQLMQLMNQQDYENSVELQIAKTYWTNMSTATITNYSGDVMRTEYSIPLQLLKKYGGTVYIKDIDYAFSIYGVTENFFHPYSIISEIIKVSHNSLKNSLTEVDTGNNFTACHNFTRSIRIVDNSGIIGDRFVKIGNDIYVIKSHKEIGMRDGIYVLTNSPVRNEMEKSEVIAERYDVCDDIPFFKLHRSYIEALNDEVSSEVRKAQLAIQDLQTREEESKNKTRRAELDAERLTVERDSLQRELEASIIKHQNEVEFFRNKVETMREERKTSELREQEERKSIERKSVLELIKTVPIAITSVVGLYVFYKKMTTPHQKL
jgi:hypothetical protein